MMNTRLQTLLATGLAAVGLNLTPAFGQTINWTGGGDGTSWANAANWSGGAVPGPANDVVITSGAGTTVVISSGSITVKSIQCSKAFTISGGTLAVTAGASLLQGAFTMASGASLSSSGITTTFTVTGPSSASAALLEALDHSVLLLSGMTNIDGCNLTVNSAGVLRLTNVAQVVLNRAVTWNAFAAGSLLDLSGVTNVTVLPYSLSVGAYSGGKVDLRRARFDEAQLRLVAQGAGSVLDLSQVSGELRGPASGNSSLYASGGGRVQMGPLVGVSWFDIYLDGATSVLALDQVIWISDCTVQMLGVTNNLAALTRINRGSLELQSGAQVSPAGVTNIDGCNLTVNSASMSVLRLTNVTQLVLSRAVTWNAFAAGSLLDLSGVTNVTVLPYSLSVGAYSGGKVDLRRARFDEAQLRLVAQGAGSVLDLSQVSGELRGPASGNSQLYAIAGGRVQMGPLVGVAWFNIYLDGATSVLPLDLVTWISDCDVQMFGVTNNLAALTRINRGSLELQSGAQVSPPGVTNINDCNLKVYGSCVLRLTNVTQVVFSRAVQWNAWYADSLLDLSAVTNVTVQPYSLSVGAYSGGKVDLQRVSDFSVGRAVVLADGAGNGQGSVVDLRGLSGFITQPGPSSSLTAQNGGNILLNDQAFLLANVSINITNNPVLPPTLIASSTLTLYGKAWHSYWVEQRDASVPDSTWGFTARVPLTNAFQPFASAPLANTAYRVWEFVADPSIVDLNRVGNGQLQLVLYGAPPKSFAVQTTNSLDRLPAAWGTYGTTGAMTNSFRLFSPFTPPTDTNQFYRAKEL